MTVANCSSLADRLVAQADGSRTAEAAAVILARGVNGWLLERVEHCIDDHLDVGRAAPDWETLVASSGAMSGGERRLIAIAASLGSSDATVNLDDALTGLDELNGRLVTYAIAHAVGLEVGLLDEWRVT